ncbi:formimidoylglutamate deiminase [Nocardioides solisilvae]|uniref:formimidoylglutamate deiminase n=1 Tax=Nocardioides solisilvae TaxID=1542435 RepID=UPI000D747D88|nr:formimidoylglutamate deiminase [Nocardioides solisilvae]
MTRYDTAYLLERAWVDDALHDEVLVEVSGGRFSRVEVGGRVALDADPAPTRLAGITLPGLANTHSHAFHRALRGRTQRDRGTFWSWREQMYAVAGRIDPDAMFELARAVYREMAAAGITTVGEFHYLHHQAGGTPYEEPNLMGTLLVEAAREAGIRITLLDACYLAGGFGEPLEGVQRRFGDGDAERWALRVEALAKGVAGRDHARVGAAIHSVRAVPADQLRVVAEAAVGRPLHVHLSEQPAENEGCRAAYGVSPTRLLHDAGVLGRGTTVVHATHVDAWDVALLGVTGTTVSLCPTTERDLADGVGPALRLHEAGSPLTLGSDSQAVVDLFEEMRATELHERLATQRRGHWRAEQLLAAGVGGHASLGWDDAGRIAVGQRADLVTVDSRSVRTAGTGADAGTVVFAASAADVTHVVVDGWVLGREVGEVGRELDDVVGRLLS